MRLFLALPWALGLLVSGCHVFSTIELHNVATASGKPSNVAVLVSVTKKHEPVSELDATSFKLAEDGKALDPQAVELKLLDPANVAAFHTVLLLDLGHATTEERKRQLSKAAAGFVRKVRQRQPVTVLVYDGSPRTRLVGEFSIEPSGSGPELFENLLMMVPQDTSRNLRGAVVAGLDALDGYLSKSPRPVAVGTLVVFSRGPDLAGRIDASTFESRLDETEHQIVYVDVRGDSTDEATSRHAKTRRIDSQEADTLPIAFEEAGMAALRLTGQYYLLSYCSPARAAERQLKVEVTVPSVKNEVETDSFVTSFDASGFAPGCNSSSPPRFSPRKKPASEQPSPGKASGQATGGRVEPGAESGGLGAPSTETAPSSRDGTGRDTEEPDEPLVPPPNKSGYAP